jgi:hypothetical protein
MHIVKDERNTPFRPSVTVNTRQRPKSSYSRASKQTRPQQRPTTAQTLHSKRMSRDRQEKRLEMLKQEYAKMVDG